MNEVNHSRDTPWMVITTASNLSQRRRPSNNVLDTLKIEDFNSIIEEKAEEYGLFNLLVLI